MKKKTMAERARELGISIYQLKQQIKQKRQEKETNDAKWQLINSEMTAGWNPNAGNKKIPQ